MKKILSHPSVYLFIEIPLIIILLMVAFPGTSASQATAQQAQEAPTAVYWYVCNPTIHVGLFTNRLHVYCSTTSPIGGAPPLDGGIHWFALPTSPDSAGASRFLSLIQSAFITAKPIWVFVDPYDTSGTSFGCGAADCRRLYGMEMR